MEMEAPAASSPAGLRLADMALLLPPSAGTRGAQHLGENAGLLTDSVPGFLP